MTLYELTGQFQELLDLIEQGEIDSDVLKDTLEGIEGEIEIKADGYAKVIRQLEGNVLMLKAEIDRLSYKKVSIENNIKAMKESLENAMRATGKTKFKTKLFNFSIQKNGGKLPLEFIEGLVSVPTKFTKPIQDNDLIREYLERGETLEFVKLGERKESLRIR